MGLTICGLAAGAGIGKEDPMDKQMTLFDFVNEDGTGFEISDRAEMKPETVKDAKICSKCKSHVWLHNPKTGNSRMSCGRKYGCKFEPRITCSMCSHFQPYTSGLHEEYHGFTCCGFGISRSENPDQEACDDFKERGGECQGR